MNLQKRVAKVVTWPTRPLWLPCILKGEKMWGKTIHQRAQESHRLRFENVCTLNESKSRWCKIDFILRSCCCSASIIPPAPPYAFGVWQERCRGYRRRVAGSGHIQRWVFPWGSRCQGCSGGQTERINYLFEFNRGISPITQLGGFECGRWSTPMAFRSVSLSSFSSVTWVILIRSWGTPLLCCEFARSERGTTLVVHRLRAAREIAGNQPI